MSPKKDCLIIIARTVPVVNTHFPFFPIFFLQTWKGPSVALAEGLQLTAGP